MENNKEKSEENDYNVLTKVVEKNIRALVKKQAEEESRKKFQEKIGERIGRLTGNLVFVYIHAFVFAVWIALSEGWFLTKPLDPSLVGLQLFTSIEAIFLTTFVLMSQNSLDTQADKRAELDLQISLLSEYELTHLITLVKSIAQKLDVEEANDPQITKMSEEILPDKLLDTVESEKQRSINECND